MEATQPRAVRGMAASSYYRPASVAEAVQALAHRAPGGAPWVVISGGTDVFPARVGRAFTEPMLDVSGLQDLRGIRDRSDGYEIGARTTWSDLLRADLPPLFDGLKLAAREVGGVQIQNAGTLAGNVCNASPAADGVPPLLAMDAEVVMASSRGVRTLPLDRFVLGNRKTALAPDELVTALRIPKPRGETRSGFLKLGSRKYLVISIVMAAAVIEVDAGRVTGAKVAVGACSPVARRLPALEAALAGRPVDGLGAAVMPGHFLDLSPIDDVRGSAAYRRDAALTLVRRLLDGIASQTPAAGARP